MKSVGITDPVTVFDDTMQVPWEVDEFWQRFKSDVLPKVTPGPKSISRRGLKRPRSGGLVEQARAQVQAAGAPTRRFGCSRPTSRGISG